MTFDFGDSRFLSLQHTSSISFSVFFALWKYILQAFISFQTSWGRTWRLETYLNSLGAGRLFESEASVNLNHLWISCESCGELKVPDLFLFHMNVVAANESIDFWYHSLLFSRVMKTLHLDKLNCSKYTEILCSWLKLIGPETIYCFNCWI